VWLSNRFSIRSVLALNIGERPVSPRRDSGRHDDAHPSLPTRPRKHFEYASLDNTGKHVLLSVSAADEAHNGPSRSAVEIIQVGEAAWIMDYVIDVAVRDCEANQLFASNRFEVTHDIDHKGYSVITTLGKVVVRSDMKKSPDTLRWVVTPPLPNGFRRKSMYQIQEDGLAMLYRITDTEHYLAPPVNAVDAEGRFTITTVPPGAIMWAQVDLTLEGRKSQSKKQLMETAILIALRRLEAGGAAKDPIKGKPFVEGGALSEELFENKVSVQLKSRFIPGQTLLKENGQYNVFKGFWQGFFLGAPFLNPIGPGVAGAAGAAGKEVEPWLAKNGGLIGRKAAEALAAGRKATDWFKKKAAQAAGAKGDPKTDDNLDRKRGKGQKPGAGAAEQAPSAPNATVDGGMLDRFGVKMDGCDQDGSIDPGLYGDMKFLAILGAAFRDPCVADAVSNLITPKNGNDVLSGGGAPPGDNPHFAQTIGGSGGGITEETSGDPSLRGVIAPLGTTDINFSQEKNLLEKSANWNVYQVLAQLAMGGSQAKTNPSLDWRAGRLKEITIEPGDASGTTIKRVPILRDENKPAAPDDEFPGIYEAWFCEIEHDFQNYACALPASVVDVAAIACQWANTQRTMTVRWSATKSDWPPEVPMNVGDPNVVMVSHKMGMTTVEIAGDGKTPIFTCTGITVYQLLDESLAVTNYPMPPWLKLPMGSMPGPVPANTIVFSSNVPNPEDQGAAGSSTLRTVGA
jgi:hypothetical protein